MANGVSTAISLVVTVVLARRFSASEFEAVNLALVVGSMVAAAGGGIDSSATRLLPRTPASRWSELLGMAFTLRALLLPVIGSIGVVAILWADIGTVQTGSVIAVFAAHAVAMSAVQASLIAPIARGEWMAYAVRQMLYFVPLLLFALSVVAWRREIGWLAIPGLAAFAVLWIAGHVQPFRRPSRRFVKMSAYLVASSFLFAAYDRIDIVVAAERFSPEVGAAYAAAARASGIYLLISSTLATVLTPIVSSIPRPYTLRGIAGASRVEVLTAVIAMVGLALVLPQLMAPVFGSEFADAGMLVAAMSARYVLLVLALPIMIALPLFSAVRHYLEMTVLQTVGVLIAVMLAPTPTFLALVPGMAPLFGILYGVVRLRAIANASSPI